MLPQINVNYATLASELTGGLIATLSQATPGRRSQIERNVFGRITKIVGNLPRTFFELVGCWLSGYSHLKGIKNQTIGELMEFGPNHLQMDQVWHRMMRI